MSSKLLCGHPLSSLQKEMWYIQKITVEQHLKITYIGMGRWQFIENILTNKKWFFHVDFTKKYTENVEDNN